MNTLAVVYVNPKAPQYGLLLGRRELVKDLGEPHPRVVLDCSVLATHHIRIMAAERAKTVGALWLICPSGVDRYLGKGRAHGRFQHRDVQHHSVE